MVTAPCLFDQSNMKVEGCAKIRRAASLADWRMMRRLSSRFLALAPSLFHGDIALLNSRTPWSILTFGSGLDFRMAIGSVRKKAVKVRHCENACGKPGARQYRWFRMCVADCDRPFLASAAWPFPCSSLSMCHPFCSGIFVYSMGRNDSAATERRDMR
jgi:hypothetical protein